MQSKIDEKVATAIMQSCEFFTNIENAEEVLVEYPLAEEITAFDRLPCNRFERYIRNEYRQLADVWVVPKELKDYLEAFVDDAVCSQLNPIQVHRRLTGSISSGRIVYNINNKARDVIVVDNEGWELLPPLADTKFLPARVDKEQAIPEDGGNLLKLLRPYVNLTKEDFLLFAIYLVQGFSFSASHFGVVLSSDMGTGKSTLTRVARELIDPSLTSITITPKSATDLKNLFANAYMACLDNTERFNAEMSNATCVAITGGTESARKLYTNSEQVVMKMKNLVIINGINAIPSKSDLADRILLFELKKISEEKRRTEADFWSSFEQDKPLILGAIFSTLAKAIKIFPTLKVGKLVRMADAHMEMIAIARALGMKEETFKEIFDSNISRRNAAYASRNRFVEIVEDFMVSMGKSHVEDTVRNLYGKVSASIMGDRNGFPGSPSAFSRKLNEECAALNKVGITFSIEKKADAQHLSIDRRKK